MDGSYCKTCNVDLYGKSVWSWHPWAGAKVAGDEPANDGDYEVMDTGESTQ